MIFITFVLLSSVERDARVLVVKHHVELDIVNLLFRAHADAKWSLDDVLCRLGALGLQVLPESRVDSPARALSVYILALAHRRGWAMSTTASWALVIPAIFLYIAVTHVCGVFVLPDLSLQVLNGLVLLDDWVEVFSVERVSDVLALSENLVEH